tara:strand:- start:1052 stop:1816 length:765 start_codon:yes stop_codon:yes gene_type:complete
MSEINILEELRTFIPPLRKEELEQLHRELDSDGRAREPLTVWKQKDVLVDGHHRYEYCTKMDYPFEVRRLSFPSIEVVKNYMILHQLARRNVDPKTASRLRGMLYLEKKKQVTNPDGNNQHGEVKAQSEPQPKAESTADDVAKETGVSRETVKRDAKFATACDKVTEMEQNGVITAEERIQIMEKPKSAIIKAAASSEEAKKVLSGTTKPKPKPKPKQRPQEDPYKEVVRAFKNLEFKEMEKAIKEIDIIWNQQ